MKKNTLIILIAILCNNAFAQLGSYIPIPTDGLLAWYPFTDNCNDSSGYTHNGIMCGSGAYGTDRFGNPNCSFVGDEASAVNFPVNNFPLGNASRSVSVFFQLSEPFPTGIRQLFAWGDNLSMGGRFGLMMQDTAFGFECMNSAVFSILHPDTLWHNLTITYPDTGTGSHVIKVYIDGEITIPFEYLSPVSVLNTDTGFMHYAGSLTLDTTYYFAPIPYDYSWSGKLDDIGIWSRALTPCEIEKIFFWPTSFKPIITASGATLYSDSVYAGNHTYANYQWLVNDTVISGATNSSHIATITGPYQIAVTTLGGCTDTSTVYYQKDTIIFTTGVANISLADNIKVFPNPSETVFNIQSPVAVNIILTNVEGEVLEKKDQVKQLDLKNYPSGIYLLSIYNETGIKIKTERLSWFGK